MNDEEDYEKMKRQEALFKVIGSKGAIMILQILDKDDQMRYSDILEYTNTHTLNKRLGDLLRYGLIEHHMVREEVRKEWYEITDKGRALLEILDHMAELVGC